MKVRVKARLHGASNRGFSLIELLIVIAIIGILVALVIPNLLDAQDRAKQRATVADLRNWGTAVSAYHAEAGSFPAEPGSQLARDIHNDLVPYAISSLRDRDHWNFDVRYYTDTINAYTIRSYAKDGLDSSPLGVTPQTWRTFSLDIVLVDGIFVFRPS